MSWKTTVYERQVLFEQVWTRPLRTVAAEHGISDVALAKICKKLGVPTPGRGYWARLAAGKPAPRPDLPPLGPGQKERHVISRRHDPLNDNTLSPEAAQLIAREADTEMDIVVPEALRRPHQWARASRPLLRKHASNPEAALLEAPCLDVRVSRSSLSRALLLIDTLLRALEKRGFEIHVTEPKRDARDWRQSGPYSAPSTTTVEILGVEVGFAIVERFTRRERKPAKAPSGTRSYSWTPSPEYDRVATGRLALEITSPTLGAKRRTWCDGKRQKIENCLGDFVLAMIQCAERARLDREEEHRRKLAWEEADRRRKEEAKRQEELRARVEDLDRRVEAWEHGRRILAFVAALRERSASGQSESVDTPDLESWIAWAEEHATKLQDDAIAGRIAPEENLRPSKNPNRLPRSLDA